MIWFTCKKCGKTHGRNDTSAGTLVFCDCGHGNTVPWESTVAAPIAPMPAAHAPRMPDLAPIQFEPGTSTGGPPATYPPPLPKPGGYPDQPPPLDDEERPTRRGRTEKRDPDYCFNHQRRPRAEACADCQEGFCRDCLVQLQGASLCGPCKNFRARREELPPAASAMASASLVISLITGPLMMCMLLYSPASGAFHVLNYLSMLPQVLAIGLGVWALREAEAERKGGGQWIAYTGIAMASLTCVMILLMGQFANRLQG
jgi:hypothetical protein